MKRPIAELRPRRLMLRDEIVDTYSIGQVAAALGVETKIAMDWITTGAFPDTPFRINRNDGCKRVYLRSQLVGIVRIAIEERVCAPDFHPPAGTKFPQRVADLFKSIARRQKGPKTDGPTSR